MCGILVLLFVVDIECEAPFRFRCDNNRCIYSPELCNSIDDCGDGSDERQENCEYSFMMAGVVDNFILLSYNV